MTGAMVEVDSLLHESCVETEALDALVFSEPKRMRACPINDADERRFMAEPRSSAIRLSESPRIELTPQS